MSKTFKVVCVNSNNSTFLKEGTVYSAMSGGKGGMGNFDICTLHGNEHYGYAKAYFLRLPTEPKTCADMTMEEWLAINAVLAGKDKKLVEYSSLDGVYETSRCDFIRKTSNSNYYRIKPDNPNADAIERIEGEMRKLADELSLLKEK